MNNIPCPTCDGPRRGDQNLCGACQAELSRALDGVPALVDDLHVTLAKQHTRQGGGGDVEDDPTPAVLHIGALPYDPRASEAMWVLRSALVGWVRQLQEAKPEPWPRDSSASMAAWLSQRLERLVRHPAAPEAHGEITEAVRAAERVTDRPAERQFAGRCQCGAALYAKPGASKTQCRECDAEAVDVREQLDRMREQVRDQLAHPTGASALLARLEIKAPESTIRRWAGQRRILAHGTDARGRSLYRIGDILDVITENHRSLPA